MGIHTPELDFERPRASVEDAVRRRGLDFPQLLDNDSAYWNALGNQYWPSLYVVDRCGRIRAHTIGEVHSGERSGKELEARIASLLDEASADCGRDSAAARSTP